MRMFDLIVKKKAGEALSDKELEFMINGYLKEEIPDYQMSAMLMAIYFKGMNDDEIASMTKLMAASGDMMDLSKIDGIKVDKHSTGGIGDKTTLIVAPIVASYGVKVIKMSGRGLGYTGGTIDKLESIKNFRTSLSQAEIFDIAKKVGLCIVCQSGNLTPADKKLYALRDVTATVDSLPLIASSIMSKKIASGSDCIVLDVKAGIGAFMKTVDEAILLAKKMVAIGESVNKKTVALITNMNIPLGNSIGNSLEVEEAIEILNGKGSKALTNLCINLAANMMNLADKGSLQECIKLAEQSLKNGKALQKFNEMVKAQGGDTDITHLEAPYSYDVISDKSGYISKIDAEICGKASVILGAGRETKESKIDLSSGIKLNIKAGDYISKNDKLATLYSSKQDIFEISEKLIKSAVTIEAQKPELEPLIYARVEKDNVFMF